MKVFTLNRACSPRLGLGTRAGSRPACPPKPWRRWARILSNTLLGFLLLLLFPWPAFAVETVIGDIPTDLGELFRFILNLFADIVGLLAIVYFIVGGYQVMFAGDDPKALAEGKSKMFAALSGIIFLLFSVVILRTLGVMLDIPVVPGI